jgi:hypothetical protein
MGSDTLTDLKRCSRCEEHKPSWEFSQEYGQPHHFCKPCNKMDNDKSNPRRMFVDGQYIPQSHKHWRPGRYKSWNAVMWGISESGESDKDPSGDIYVVTNPAWPEYVKVGLATVSAEDRCKQYQTGTPFRDYKVEWSMSTRDCKEAEKLAHRAIAQWAEKRNEWFRIDVPTAIKIIEGDMRVQSLAK